MANPPASVAVERIEMAEGLVARANALGTDLVVLPRRTDAEAGVYGEACVDLVKKFRSAGVTAAFADAPERRHFEVKKGATSDVVQFVALAIASNGSYDLAKAAVLQMLGRFARQPLELEYTHVASTGGSTSWRLKGAAADIAEVVKELPTGYDDD